MIVKSNYFYNVVGVGVSEHQFLKEVMRFILLGEFSMGIVF